MSKNKKSMKGKRPTKGDVLRINITPPKRRGGYEDRPWLKIYNHPYGIKNPGKLLSDEAEASKGQSRKKVARLIGDEVIKCSRILTRWFEE